MLDELARAIKDYQNKWGELVKATKNQEFFSSLEATAVGWKTKDIEDFNQRFNELRDLCDQVHLGWINERWLATLHLKESVLPRGLSVIKLMQRRPNSDDATGLDHLDFYLAPGRKSAKAVVEQEDVRWTEEKNGEYCKWISLWFAETEAKLRSDTVLDVCANELKDAEKQVLTELAK